MTLEPFRCRAKHALQRRLVGRSAQQPGGKFLLQVDVLSKIMTEAQTADAISRLPDSRA
jgi:hypothetical protein